MLIQVAKESAEKYSDNFTTPVLLVIKEDSENIDSYLIQANLEEEARETIKSILQKENVTRYILIGKGKVTNQFYKAIEVEDIGLLPKSDYQEILMVAYVDLEGAVEHYICNVEDLIREPYKGKWRKEKMVSIKNVVVREW